MRGRFLGSGSPVSGSFSFLLIEEPRGRDSVTLFVALDCLRSFTDLEELDDSELYMCHKCKKKQKSTKKFWMQKLPKVSAT